MPKTKVAGVRRKSKSLRTTIPEAIVEYLGIKKGDQLEWTYTDHHPIGKPVKGLAIRAAIVTKEVILDT